jgi:PAS domain S-box-containing protein
LPRADAISTHRDPGGAFGWDRAVVAESGLAEAELSAVLASAMDAVVAVDEDQRILLFNPAAAKMFGCAAADALGSPLGRFIPERFREEHEEAIRRFGATGGTARRMGALREVVALRSDGVEFPAEASISQVEVHGRKIFAVILRDVTQQRGSEKAVRLLASLVEHSDDAILSKNLDGVILTWNRGAQRIYGYAAQEMVGRSISVLVPADRSQEVREILEKVRLGKSIERLQTVRIGKGGRRLDVVLTISPIRDHREATVGASVIARDVTAELANLNALREAERKVRVAQELASIGTLAAGLAHEVGTPMNVILGYAQMLEGSASDEETRRTARVIAEQVGRVSGIIRTLLNIARPGERKHVQVNLASVVEAAAAFLSEKLSHRNITLERDFEPIPLMWGESERLQQLLLNLFLNAVDAMPHGGILRTQLRATGDGVIELRVADTGSGIPKEALPRVFEPFFTTKARGKGNGLGLAVCKGIVGDHGGEIEVRSETGSGTEFRIRFPAADPPATA